MGETMRLTAIDFVALGAYLVVAVGIGAWFARRERTSRDYFRASGRVPWWAAGLSLFATWLSAITFIGIPAKVMATNWAYFLGVVAPIVVVPIVRRYVIPFYRDLDITTAYEYLDKRFGRTIRLLASGVFIVFHLGRSAIILVLPALALWQAVGLSLYTSIALMGLLSVIYTMLGGIEAVVWTDVLQVLVLLGGAAIAMTIGIVSLDGGLIQFFEVARADDKFALYNAGWSPMEATAWVIFLGYGSLKFASYVADQAMVQRYLTTRDARSAGRALWMSVGAGLVISVIFYTFGTAMYVFYQSHPQMMPEGAAMRDAIVPVFLMQQLPIGLAGLVIAGIFAAGMSTIDSSMNAIASTVLTDFYQPVAGAVSERRQMRVARGATLAVGAIATGGAALVAAMKASSLLDVFLTWYGAMVGLLAGLFVLGIFTVRSTGLGALVGILVAGAAVVSVSLATAISFFLYPLIGLGVCIAVGYAASLAAPTRPGDLTGLTWHTRVKPAQAFSP